MAIALRIAGGFKRARAARPTPARRHGRCELVFLRTEVIDGGILRAISHATTAAGFALWRAR